MYEPYLYAQGECSGRAVGGRVGWRVYAGVQMGVQLGGPARGRVVGVKWAQCAQCACSVSVHCTRKQPPRAAGAVEACLLASLLVLLVVRLLLRERGLR